ncbi:MAG: glutamate-cysteine ligase family protein [Planctomycetota bacterium]
MREIYEHFERGFRESKERRSCSERRIGAELKFPLVNPDGESVDYPMIVSLWEHLMELGWEPVKDDMSGRVVGARKPGEENYTVASCETGYSKTEFSMAHVANLWDLEESVEKLRHELEIFADRHDVRFLGMGIHPMTPPGEHLLMEQSRTSVWDKIFPANEHIPEERGDDFHLFTINSASHVHISVDREEAMPMVNVFNGFAPAQIALTANSSIWQGEVADYHCVAEKFWDWWMPEDGRVGVPPQRFEDLKHYARVIAQFKPVYVKRDGTPIVLKDYDSFADYYEQDEAYGTDPEGNEVKVTPRREDVDLHSTCYWFNARLSHYYTVEGRLNDQQPPEDVLCVAALTLGLAAGLEEAREVIDSYEWEDIRRAREAACRDGIKGSIDGMSLEDFAGEMLEVAREGLRKREKGEERFLEPLEERLRQRTTPAEKAVEIYQEDGIEGLVDERSL